MVDADDEPALWQPDPKVGRVPMRFRTEVIAQAARSMRWFWTPDSAIILQ